MSAQLRQPRLKGIGTPKSSRSLEMVQSTKGEYKEYRVKKSELRAQNINSVTIVYDRRCSATLPLHKLDNRRLVVNLTLFDATGRDTHRFLLRFCLGPDSEYVDCSLLFFLQDKVQILAT